MVKRINLTIIWRVALAAWLWLSAGIGGSLPVIASAPVPLQPYEVLDINTAANVDNYGSNAYLYTRLDDSLFFFVADDAEHGYELWKSEGLAAGTALVKDIFPGLQDFSTVNSSYPNNLTAFNGKLYFFATDETHGAELWVTDGSEANTQIVADLNASGDGVNTTYNTGLMAVSNNMLYFVGDNGDGNGFNLWKLTASTGAAPARVAVINASGTADINYLTDAGGVLFFSAADDSSHGMELWKSSGDAASTAMVEDLNPGSDNSSPKNLLNVGGVLYFNATVGVDERLYKTSGSGVTQIVSTADGTPLVPTYLTDVNGTLYFNADAAGKGLELWKTDGSADGTTVIDIVAGSGGSNPQSLVNVDGVLYFSALSAASDRELWKYSAGTASLVQNINPTGSSSPQYLTNVGGTLFFSANDSSHGLELWSSDGTTTAMVKDLYPGGDSYPVFLFAWKNKLYFTASEDGTQWEPFVSDGSLGGTHMLLDVNTWDKNASPQQLKDVSGTLFFYATEPTHGAELWKSDGTAAGTQLVKDINPGTGGSSFSNFTAVGSTLYATVFEPTGGEEVWKSDGSAGGTTRLKDICSGSGGSYPSKVMENGGVLFFSATDCVSGRELWKSDGSEVGTVQVKDIRSGSGDGVNPNVSMVVSGGLVYFQASDGVNGWELWQSDGSASGTQMVKDINPGGDALVNNLIDVNGTLFFSAFDGTNSSLWKTDPVDGAVKVKDLQAGNSSVMSGGYDDGGTLIFSGNDGTHGWELWKSGGTEATTSMIEINTVDDSGSDPGYFTKMGSFVYFSAYDGSKYDVWRYAAESGAARLTGFSYVNATPEELTVFNDKLYFKAKDGVHGQEVWVSGGTVGDEGIVQDITPGPKNDSSVSWLTASGPHLFFSAKTFSHGYELWAIYSPLAPKAFTSSAPAAGTVGSAYNHTFAANGTPAPTYELKAGSGALPGGLELNGTSGVLSGTPTTAGTYGFTITASNSAGSIEQVVSLLINPPPSNPPTAFTSGAPSAGMLGKAYSHTFAANGSPAPTFAVKSGALPDGLSLNAASGALSGMPTAAGTYPFTLTASNVDGSFDQNFEIVIHPAPALALGLDPAAHQWTLTYSVPTWYGTGGGTVAFQQDGSAIAGCEAVALVERSAACTLASLPFGSHQFTVVFGDNGSLLAGATSAASLYSQILPIIFR